jgi:acetyltransferase-like isoleucine patch superfamily enzyme
MDIEEIPYTGNTNPVYDYPKHVGRIRLFFNSLVCHICRIIPFIEIKNSLYRMIGVKIGKNVVIAAYTVIDPFFPELITIEDNVIVGVGATILAHEYTQEKLRKGRVHIKKRALIGAGSLIRCGITVGEHAVVGAKSFVNKDIPDFTTVGGVPAKLKRKKKKNNTV